MTENTDARELLGHLDRLHTTEGGVQRIRKNASLEAEDVISWCRARIKSPSATIERRGKNWYATADGYVLTINAGSYTVITAHKQGGKR